VSRGLAIRLRGVIKRYGEITAVAGLDLDVPEGTCVGLLGPNGAGKTTTMKMLTAQAIADEGELEVLGHVLPGDSKAARAECGVVPQLDNLDVTLTTEQNLLVFAHLYRIPRAERQAAIEWALDLANLRDRRETRVDRLSGGMRRRLLIARALVHRPRLLLLDEPTVGLDPQVRQELWALIDNLRSEGTSILMSTHYIEEAQRLADTVTIMSHGSAHAAHGHQRRGARQRPRPRRRATAGQPRGRLRPAHRRGDRVNGRLERSALSGVLVREVVNFSSFWKSTTFSSTVQPTIYLIAFGFGFGSLVTTVDGYDYVEFVATGTVATGVLFASVFPAMFGTFVKFQFQRTYDAILAAPVDTEELVTAEALWIAGRAGAYGSVPLLVGMVFGLDPAWGMLTVPIIGFLAGFGWGSCGIMIAGIVKSIDGFSYVSAALLTPLFLVAGTFFPLTQLPHWAQVLGNFNPLFHCVQLVRHASFGWQGWADVGHLAVIVGFGLVMWRLAIVFLQRRLID
jgi:lipooligosaccharide transport system permease protein